MAALKSQVILLSASTGQPTFQWFIPDNKMILFVFEKNHDFQNSLSWAKIVGLFVSKNCSVKLFSSKQLDDNINKLEHGSFIEQDCFISQKSVQT